MKKTKGEQKKSSTEAPSKIPTQRWQNFFYVVGLSTWVFVVVVGVQFLVTIPAAMIIPMEALRSTLGNAILSIICYILALFILLWLSPRVVAKWQERSTKKPVKPAKFNRERMGLSGLPTWTDIGLAPIGYIASIVIAMGLTAVFKLFPWFEASEAQDLGYSFYMQGVERGIAFIALAIVAPIMEEIIFRGFLYGKLRIKTPKWLAIFITSLIFGLIHLQWNVGISVFAMSIVTCTLREITGTIYAGMLVHIINNGVAFFLVYVIGMM